MILQKAQKDISEGTTISMYKETFSFFMRYIFPAIAAHRVKVMLSILLLFLSTFLYVAGMEFSRLVIQAIQQSLDGEWVVVMIPNVFGSEANGLLFGVSMLCAFSFSLAYTASYYRDVAFESIALDLTVSLRKQLFKHLLHTKYEQFSEFESSVLVKRLISDLGNVRMILVEALMLRSADVALFVGMLIYLFMLSWTLTLVSLFMIIAYFVMAGFFARVIGPHLYKSDVSTETLTSHLNQSFQRVLDIKSNQRECNESTGFDELADRDYKVKRRTVTWLMLDRSLTGWLSAILPVVITLVGGLYVLAGALSLDEILVFVATINMLVKSVDRLTEIPMVLSRAQVSIRNVDALFSLSNEKTGLLKLGAESASPTVLLVDGFKKTLSDGHMLSLNAIKVNENEKVALIGPSGCGKSSLFYNLLKLSDGYDGRLELNGSELSSAQLESTRSYLSFMHQHSMVLPECVINNITYSSPGSAVDIEMVRYVLKSVGLEELLALDNAFNSEDLSGGQKRRLCLARAMYRKAPLMLLDEPLTGVGPSQRAEIVKNLMGRTGAIIMVTHQYDLLPHFDRVVFMAVKESVFGRVTFIGGQGKHEDLLLTNNEYKRLVNVG